MHKVIEDNTSVVFSVGYQLNYFSLKSKSKIPITLHNTLCLWTLDSSNEKLPQGEKMEATSGRTREGIPLTGWTDVQQMSLISNSPTKSLNTQIAMTKYLRQVNYKIYVKSVDPGERTEWLQIYRTKKLLRLFIFSEGSSLIKLQTHPLLLMKGGLFLPLHSLRVQCVRCKGL